MHESPKGPPAINLDELRARLRKMPDDELRKFGKSAAHLCTAAANPNKPFRDAFEIQLEEARAEWKRRADLKRKGH